MKLKEFVKRYGDPYSEMLGIDLRSHKNGEIVKWFLASILYGKPIRESTATTTYKTFESEGVSWNGSRKETVRHAICKLKTGEIMNEYLSKRGDFKEGNNCNSLSSPTSSLRRFELRVEDSNSITVDVGDLKPQWRYGSLGHIHQLRRGC
jgi:hypothetical protein